MNSATMINRHTVSARINHWLVALTFLLAGASGLAFFHPAFFWLSALFGGGTWARILHPFFGALMAGLFLLWVARVWKDNRIIAADWQWARHLDAVLRNETRDLPELGKYNLGQKLLTRTLLGLILLLLATGCMLWQPWFAQEFAIPLRRKAVVIHFLSAWVALLCLIVHVYAAIWTQGSIRAMIRGTVSAAWARHHHAAWYRESLPKQ